jgi:electron transfer flavoprotein beta subunit
MTWFIRASETLKVALAMGADKAIHIQTDERIDMNIQPLLVSKLIKYFATKEKVDMIVMGKQSIDDDYNQTGQMTAALLGWPQATFASKVEMGEKDCKVDREVDGGTQVLSVQYPCVVTCDLRLNEPRNASIKQIMAAKKKPIEVIELKSVDVGKISTLEVVSIEEPAKRQAGVMVETVDQLLDKLKNEAKCL